MLESMNYLAWKVKEKRKRLGSRLNNFIHKFRVEGCLVSHKQAQIIFIDIE